MFNSETDQISIRYYTNNFSYEREHYSTMLTEDLHKSIVPVYDYWKKEVSVHLTSEDEDLQTQLIELLPASQSYYDRDFTQKILGAIEYIARELIYHGQAAFEYVTAKDLNEEMHYSLELIYGDFLIKKDSVIQIIPKEHINENVPELITIPKDKCYIIHFPNELGGKLQHLNFIEDFKAHGMIGPKLYFFRNPLAKSPHYDYSKHRELYELELWKKSKFYDWHHRGNNSKLFSGFHHVLRRLKFRKNQILLRDSIIEQLNNVIKNLPFNVDKNEIRIDGLLTLERIDVIIEQWKKGSLVQGTLDEIY